MDVISVSLPACILSRNEVANPYVELVGDLLPVLPFSCLHTSNISVESNAAFHESN